MILVFFWKVLVPENFMYLVKNCPLVREKNLGAYYFVYKYNIFELSGEKSDFLFIFAIKNLSRIFFIYF